MLFRNTSRFEVECNSFFRTVTLNPNFAVDKVYVNETAVYPRAGAY
jgi:hypothetical protein